MIESKAANQPYASAKDEMLKSCRPPGQDDLP